MCLACEMDAWWLPAIEAARDAKASRAAADLTLVPFAAAGAPDTVSPSRQNSGGSHDDTLSIGWLFEPVDPAPLEDDERRTPSQPNPFRCEDPDEA